jgi:hypothetical protein
MAWALAISLIFSSIIIVLAILFFGLSKPRERRMPDGRLVLVSNEDQHKIMRMGLLGLMAAFILYLAGVMDALLRTNNITDPAMVGMIDTVIDIIGALIYIFVALLFLWLLFYSINKVMEAAKMKKQKVKL